MPYPNEQQINTGLYVPTTDIWEAEALAAATPGSDEYKDLIVRLYQNINTIALALNNKVSGYCIEEEFVTGKSYFNPASSNPLELRPSYSKTFNIGALGAGVTAVNHDMDITDTWKLVSILGGASNTTTLDYYPLPFASAAGNNIEVRMDATQLVIDNASGVTFTDTYVTVEFVKY